MRIMFSNGKEFDVKTVPVYLLTDADSSAMSEVGGFGNPPQLPMIAHTTATGETQQLPAHEGTEEYAAYIAAYRAYREERLAKEQEYDRLKAQKRERASLLWAFAGLEVPDDWNPPEMALRAAGVEPAGPDKPVERLLQYIRYGLIQSSDDDMAVFKAMWGQQAVNADDVEQAEKDFF